MNDLDDSFCQTSTMTSKHESTYLISMMERGQHIRLTFSIQHGVSWFKGVLTVKQRIELNFLLFKRTRKSR